MAELQDRLKLLRKLAESRGFTESYQEEQIIQGNIVCHKKRSPATDKRYARALDYWKL
jgi:hypothetical protein